MLVKPVKCAQIFHHKCVNGAKVTDEGPKDGRYDISPEHCQIVNLSSGTTDTEEKFKLASLNVGNMRGCSGEIVETLIRRKVNVCSAQEISRSGASARIIMRKGKEYTILAFITYNFLYTRFCAHKTSLSSCPCK